MKVNHHSLAYKMQARPNKTYKDLRQKQKAKISDWMYQAVSEYYGKHCEMPEGEAVEQITARIYDKTKSLAIWIPYDEVHRVFLLKLPRFEERITADRMAEAVRTPPKKKPVPATSKKKGNSNKACPNCGRKMKQQFIGLQHCRCGTSRKKGEGFFERSEEMVFTLERRRIGKKVKQCPVIRYRGS